MDCLDGGPLLVLYLDAVVNHVRFNSDSCGIFPKFVPATVGLNYE